MRVVAGAVAVHITLSPWLLAVMVFLFLSLALGKRAVELRGVIDQGNRVAKGRGWQVGDLPFVTTCGIGSAFITAMVIGLYVASETAPGLYKHPVVLWALVPLILWWSCRVWLKVGRGELHDDPVAFAIKDKGSWAVVVVSIAMVLAAGPKGTV